MWARGFGPVLLLVALIGLAPFAHASPPDQTWLPGFWDDADCDNIVSAVTSMVGTLLNTALRDPGPVILVIATLRLSQPSPPESVVRAPAHLRGPPLA